MLAGCLAVFVWLISGCDNPFAPRLDTSPYGASILGDQTTVEGVFQNFKQAYSFRDSTIYGQLLAQNFIFTFQDYEHSGASVSWGRDDEIRSTYGLFQNVQRLDLTWNSIISSSGDSLKQTILRNFNLAVTFNAGDVEYANGYANLTLERTLPTDTWKITRWQDESNF
jgi:hypothetical protein